MEPFDILSRTFSDLARMSPWYWLLAGIAAGWCFLSGRLAMVLKILYFLAVYMMFIANKFYWIDFFGGQPVGLYTYIVSSTTLVLLGVFSLFRESY